MHDSHYMELVHSIQQETKALNVNNVTRTMAYLDYFRRNPEIDWSFLAHMVSRNAGWNMTDLKGEFLPKLLSEEERTHYFMWLERGNWLIFQDAFPQLLLYEASKRQRAPLFSLLHHFHVSRFMEKNWNDFWRDEDQSKLTIALIINEQNYIETRIIQNEEYKVKIMDKTSFALQDLLNLNYILFPYEEGSSRVNLLGRIVHDFTSLEERISIGKCLYAILFQSSGHLQSVLNWAFKQNHTASRKDFWPHLFHDVKVSLPGRLFNPQIKSCNLKKGVPKLYSPQLQYVWPDVDHEAPMIHDWYQGALPNDLFSPTLGDESNSVKKNYCSSLEKLSLAVYTKKAIFERR
ncbi:DUF2515 family protein [Pseudalkalibacillus sp. Hm43]|uniref:DUF2515 family protein n=1 Tax=Pseudalkalibacillus sp. Hm43 TaxID=3450742 RepID=UPI003F4216E3